MDNMDNERGIALQPLDDPIVRRLMPLTATLVLALALSIITGIARAAETQPASIDHSAFNAILKAHVRHERIDYLMLRKQHYTELSDYLDQLAAIEVDELARDEQLALYINLYNATMICAVIDRFGADYSPEEDKFAVFDTKIVRQGGKQYSLNHLENKIIRPKFNEPRIHVALVCGARSCPPLLPRAYRAADLDEVLEANMKRFVSADLFRNQIDRKRRRMQLSSIFEWYADDFGGKQGVGKFVDRYHDRDLSSFKISYGSYSWKLNVAAPAKGRWVKLTRAAGDGTKPGQVFEVLKVAGDRLVLGAPLTGRTLTVARRFTAAYVVELDDE
jgi:hypothetical protein